MPEPHTIHIDAGLWKRIRMEALQRNTTASELITAWAVEGLLERETATKAIRRWRAAHSDGLRVATTGGFVATDERTHQPKRP